MSQQPTRGRQLPARFDHQSRAEQDIDRIFTQLFPEPVIQPPSRRLRRIVTDGDGGVTEGSVCRHSRSSNRRTKCGCLCPDEQAGMQPVRKACCPLQTPRMPRLLQESLRSLPHIQENLPGRKTCLPHMRIYARLTSPSKPRKRLINWATGRF